MPIPTSIRSATGGTRTRRPALRAAALALVLLVTSALTHAAAQVNLEVALTVPTAPVPTGQSFPVKIDYRCASSTAAAVNPVLEVPVPPGMVYEAHETSPDVESAVYDAARGVMVFTFKSPMAAGRSGQLGLTLRHANGSVPDGTVTPLTASFDADNAAAASATEPVTARAQSRFRVLKYVHAGGAVDAETSYAIQVCNGTYFSPETGSLDLRDVVVDDVLPPGATFVRFDYPGGSTASAGAFDPWTGRARVTISQLRPGECVWTRVVVRYDRPANNPGDYKTNTATGTATPLGQPPVTEASTVTHQLTEPQGSSVVSKTADRAEMLAGDYGRYDILTRNDGTTVMYDYAVVDEFPGLIRVQSVSAGKYEQSGVPAGATTLTVQYKTNLNATWRNWSPPGLALNAGGTFALVDIGLSEGGPEWPTAVRWAFTGPVAPGFVNFEDATVDFRLVPEAPATVITNCAVGTASSAGVTHRAGCAFISSKRADIRTVHAVHAQIASPATNPFDIGDEVTLEARIGNGATASESVYEPAMAVLLPRGIALVPDSYEKLYSPVTAGVPSFSVSENHGGSGRTLLLARYDAPGAHILPNRHEWIRLRVRVTDRAESGATPLDVQAFMFARDVPDRCWSGDDLPDGLDLDGDGDLAETPCSAAVGLAVNPYTAASSVLEVRGSLDADYSTYPATGRTLPGGLADYRLTVTNDGNTALDSLTVIDLLPDVGDRGVVDTRRRQSKWRPRLVGPVAAPEGVTVYYSTAYDPCREGAGFASVTATGCAPPEWSVVPPEDITTVSAVKFEFGDRVLGVGESVRFAWPMRARVRVLDRASPGQVAWNSAGFAARVRSTGAWLLPSEPIKTGLELAPLQPGVVGDRVWRDDGDGVQEAGEPGVKNVRVELYRDDGDGVAEVDEDAFVSFTLTSVDGDYLFPGLGTGDYFLLFERPPGYGLAPAGRGTDPELDSDGVLYYANGRTAAATAVFSITDTQFDYSRDLGLEPSGKAAFGDYVWDDANGDGVQDEGVGAGVNGVQLDLLSATNLVVATTRTRPDLYGNPGHYLFEGVDPGSYRVRVRVPDGTTLSPRGQGTDAAADSDGDPGDDGRTDLITVAANEYRRDVDFALQLSGTEICDNGIDDDGDGRVDCADGACAGSALCAPRFACDNTLYQTIKVGTDYWLYRVDVAPVGLVPLANLTAAGVVGEINSTILNPRDGYIYALEMRSPHRAYRVTADLAVDSLGEVAVPAGVNVFNAGAVDRNGNWVVREPWSAKFYNVDLNTLVATEVCDFSGETDTRNVGDFDYNPVDGFYYGTLHDTDSLLRYDFATCTRSVVRMSRRIPESTGAFWVSADGTGYGYENATGKLIRIDLQTGAIDDIGSGGPTAQTDGCSCQGVKLTKDATARLIRKGEVNTYAFTVYNRYFTNLNDAVFRDALPAGATWASPPYDLSPDLVFGQVTGVGTGTLTVEATNVPQVVSTFKVDYVVDRGYAGPHPMPNQAYLRDLPAGIGGQTPSDDPTTEAFFDPTYVRFVEDCDNGIDDDVDGFTDCEDGECPYPAPVARVSQQ